MATLIAYADGNLTGASTFKAAETGTSALAIIRNNTANGFAAAASATSSSFTVTNGKVIEGALLWVYNNVAAASANGTFKVDLQKGGVSQASVTVNKSDLPDTQSLTACPPVFFKFTSTATGDGGSNWTIVVTTTGSTGLQRVNNSATAADWTRALRTSTTATPAAADDLYIVGELTGAGTHNSRAVTMDSTATTAYGNGSVNSTSVNGGGIRVSNYGTLSYGTSASTNYVLRINGDLEVYQYGTLNIGSSGAEIPRTSTAVLEFQMASASGDFGLIARNNSTVNIAGLSRTSGKNVVKAKLTSDVASANVTGTFVTTAASNVISGSLDAGTSLLASSFTDNASNTSHYIDNGTSPGVTNTTQTFTCWLARGSGTNNRYVRVEMGNNGTLGSVTNGFYADVDLQAGTIGTCTAIGNGTATSATITPCGTGFVVRIVGKVSSGAASPFGYIIACSAAGTTSYAGNSTQCFLYAHLAIVTGTVTDTTFNVDTDTGWKSGDIVCVASTTRTNTQCQDYLLSADAGASSFTSAQYPFGNYDNDFTVRSHNGTSPIQAEIGLLTRNVKIRSISTTLWGYVYFEALATVTVSWAEFYYLGLNSNPKYGVVAQCGTTTNAKSITFCSMHETYVGFFSVNASTSLNATVSNNVVWNTTLSGMGHLNTITNTDWTFDSNLVMKPTQHCFALGDIGGTVTNNIAVGAGSVAMGFEISEASNGMTLGTFDSNIAHSGASNGMRFNDGNQFVLGTISNFTAYRNAGTGIQFGGVMAGVTLNNITLFGNASSSGQIAWGTLLDSLTITGTNIIAGDTTFSSPVGIGISTVGAALFDVSNVDMSGTTSIFAPHTADDLLFPNSTSNGVTIQGTFNNCKFGAPSVILNKTTGWTPVSYLCFEKYNQTAGDHRTEMTYGVLKTDSTLYNTASPSMRMTPNNASSKLQSAPKGKGILVPVLSGSAVNVSVYVRKSASGDGAAYNGNQPRLIQRANAALGQTADVVLATYSASTGSWNQISGTSSIPTDDGAWEFIIDCDGTTGWVNVDDWAVS